MDNSSEETHWDFFTANVDGEYSFVLVNMDLISVAPLPDYKFMGFLEVKFLNPTEGGMYTTEESAALNAIEDQIELIDGTDAIYAGRKTGSGTREFYFYAKDQKTVETTLTELMKPHPDYKFAVGSILDAEWKNYTDFLYPNEMGLNEIRNRAVLDNLARHGDISSKPRICDHSILFGDKAAVSSFTMRAEEMGFVVSVTSSGIFRKTYDVLLKREDAPIDIDEVTYELEQLAKEFGGEYDGWGTTVVKE
jgi:regulator of RNase E activity RraB